MIAVALILGNYIYLTRADFTGDEVVYCDPPYLPSTRRRGRIYRYDYDKHDHERFLEIARLLPCKVLISGYPSELYDVQLREWNTCTFSAKTHSGVRLEQLWFNYDPPKCLHDSRYLGNDFRERQNVRRRAERLKHRISSLSYQEQHSLSAWLAERLSGG